MLEAAFAANRRNLLSFIRSRLSNDIAEDVLHEVWLRLPRGDASAPDVRSPRSYLFRIAHSAIIDHERQRRAKSARDTAFADVSRILEDCGRADAESTLIHRQLIARVGTRLHAAGHRVATVFRRHRIDGATQREIADELNVSIGTIEGDLRKAYRLLLDLKAEYDQSHS
ncbi:RNA polymerase sigma factor [Sphingomonas sp. Leaf412]|uniref:RNA polymerase sigma factor n=1 Tax=Sphingomonas sp. Leaf412 TaxID=1736370 RepID=UPI00138F2DD7|nr:RNA polymerase sigma factor [Sphingomonas sp. Leaf412]